MQILNRNQGLTGVLLFKVGLPVLLVLVVFLSASLHYVSTVIQEQLQRELRQVARAIRLPVTQALNSGDFEQLNYSLKSLLDISEVYGVYLFDNEGRRIVTLGSVKPTRKQATDALAQTEGEEFDQYENIRGRHVYSFFLPIFDQAGQPSGLLQVTRRYSDIQASLYDFKLYSWISLSALTLFLAWMLFVTHKRAIGRYLRELLAAMKTVESGDQSYRAPLKGPREITELAKGMNSMLDAIHQADQRAKQELALKKEMLEKLRQSETLAAIGQLSSGVAHELGAPLSVVDGRAQRVQRRFADDAQTMKELDDIRYQVQRMSRIIEQLLTYGRSSRIKRQVLAVDKLVQHAIDQCPFDCTVNIEPGPKAEIFSDYLSIEQCLINVLRNAWQANPTGPIVIGWEVNHQQETVIFIEDQGPGIPVSDQEKIFEPFVTTKQPGEGSGLGLAIVQRIMTENSGRIEIHPGQEKGTRIELIFPSLNKDQE